MIRMIPSRLLPRPRPPEMWTIYHLLGSDGSAFSFRAGSQWDATVLCSGEMYSYDNQRMSGALELMFPETIKWHV